MAKRIQHIITILLLLLMACSGKVWGQTWTWTDPSSGVGYKKISYAYTGNASANGANDVFDCKVDTKLGVNNVKSDGTGGVIIICQTSKAIKLTGYTFITANDNHEKSNVQWYRNPGKWQIFGCKTNSATESDWTLLVDNTAAIDMTMENRPYHAYTFACTPPDDTKYTYFKLVITSTQGQAMLQFSEFYPRELESENYPMVYYGTLPAQYGYYTKINVPQNRTHNSITLTGDQGSNTSQTIDNTTKVAFHDKTSTPMELVVGETGTLTVTSGDVSNVGAYLYIDADKNGFATSDMVQSITTGANSQWEMPLPSTLAAGRYRMRFKTEGTVPTSGSYVKWVDNSIDKTDPNGSKYYMLNGGCATDMMLHVYQPYTLTMVNKPAGASISVAEAKEETYTADGTVYVIKSSLDESDVTVTEISEYRSTISIDNTNHTITVNYFSKCFTPSFSQSDNNVTINCASPSIGATIYYTTDGTEPSTTNGTSIASGTTITVAYGTTIKAIAVADGYDNSDVAEYFVSERPAGSGTADDPYIIISGSQLNNIEELLATKSDAYFKLNAEINASGYTPSSNAFTGTFDGNFKTITGLTKALFSSVTGTVKNVTLDNVTISGGENVGAIANEASGDARIYNCQVLASNSRTTIADPANEDKTFSSSSSVSGSGAVGGIVGKISGNARVINCVSYADVSGGEYASGIVGKYEGYWLTDKGTTVSSDRNFVMNCLMLGDVKSGTNKAPVVGGAAITTGISTYSYFRYPSMPNIASMTQNGALSVETDMWLKRYEFFRSVLNTHRDLASVYCFNTADKKSEMAKWTIDESISPWPILKAHDENTTKTLSRTAPVTTEDYAGKQLTEMGSGGNLSVNISINGSSYSATLPITDMDTLRYDYTWGKVILPFANEFSTANGFAADWTRDYDYVCIGWEITGVTGGTPGTFDDYNFADRNCTDKDLYSKCGYIFAQGGQYIVPYGVTGINIEAHFAKAYYLADAYYDMDISEIKIVDNAHNGSAKGNGGKRPTTYHGKTVYTSIANAWAAMSDNYKPHDQAIVLVGNYHYSSNMSETYKSKGCTLMSVDEDNDQEPDYSWQFSLVGNNAYQKAWPAMRWDFVPLLGSGVFQMCGAYTAGITLPRTTGWWEMTETSLVRTYEFEVYDNVRAANDNGKGNNAWIFNGGYHQAMVRCKSSTNTKLSYIKLGGNVYIKDLHPGNHSEGSGNWSIRPINITGGEIKNCYMTGMKAGEQIITATGQPNNVRFYCAGGKLHKYLSCYMERPVNNATVRIDHALIDKFFGGGTSPVSPVSGDIDIQIDNSLVNQFCGGPEFGDMVEGKTITVHAKGTTFGEYFGAGYGGTAFTLIKHKEYSDKDLSQLSNPGGVNGYIGYSGTTALALKYNKDQGGTCVDFEYETLMNARGQVCERCFVHRAALSLATTKNVTSTIENCIVLGNFYGGGCQGMVDGTITSSLTHCDVRGSVFGGGYKANIPSISVMGTTMNSSDYSWFNPTFGFFTSINYPATTEYKWITGTENGKVDNTNHTITTTTDMTQMGNVTGAIDLTITNGTVGGSVFGGGNESLSKNNTSVKILGSAEITGNVYGGGNAAEVQGTTKVQIGDECITTP